ncbi:hypothetical protein D3C84_928390 [compost metagenome]
MATSGALGAASLKTHGMSGSSVSLPDNGASNRVLPRRMSLRRAETVELASEVGSERATSLTAPSRQTPSARWNSRPPTSTVSSNDGGSRSVDAPLNNSANALGVVRGAISIAASRRQLPSVPNRRERRICTGIRDPLRLASTAASISPVSRLRAESSSRRSGK